MIRHAHKITLLLFGLVISSSLSCRFMNRAFQSLQDQSTPPLESVTSIPQIQPIASLQPADTSQPTAPVTQLTPAPELTQVDLYNAEYCFPSLAADSQTFEEVSPQGCVRLKDGQFGVQDQADPLIMLIVFVADHYIFTDLDGDLDQDAVVVIGLSGGGSGTFFSLAAVINEGGVAKHKGTFGLGDRVIVEQILAEDGKVTLNYIGHGPQDPMCCPTQPMSVTLIYRNGALVDAISEQVGPYADQAITALRNQDMQRLAQLVHPQWGVRFSPYSYVLEEHLVFTPEQLAGLLQDPTIYQWGNYDGSGEPILLTFSEYFDRFVYRMDFANAPQISFNQRLGFGNTIDNSREFYPGAVVVEYYFPGQDPQYGGMDWHSLRLVFRSEGELWYLVGVISDEWTI